MRPVLAVVIWIVLVGGLGLYVRSHEAVKTAQSFQSTLAQGAYALEITPTFAAEPDPFALRTEEGEAPPALIVKLNGRELVKLTERVEAGAPIMIEPLKGLVEGSNEVYLEANPPIKETGRSNAVRVRVLRDGIPVSDRSFWSVQGSKIATTMLVNAAPVESQEEDGHAH
jgi:hypothetical protein